MNVDLRYLGRSELRSTAGGIALSLAPNLRRPKVFFDGEIRHPVRFREAMSALHDVVVGDLRFQKKDRTAYEAWKTGEAEREQQLRDAARADPPGSWRSRRADAAEPGEGLPRCTSVYWRARRSWANELARNDPELFRAPGAVRSGGHRRARRGLLRVLLQGRVELRLPVRRSRRLSRRAGRRAPGTTNVDYSLALYEHFQTLRSYRPTRLLVDPTGFEVKVEGHAELPRGEDRSAAGVAARLRPAPGGDDAARAQVELPVEAVYSLLAYLKRHREKTGPRSLRFAAHARASRPTVVLEPWGTRLSRRGPALPAARGPRRSRSGAGAVCWRWRASCRSADRIEVRLLGSGLPSIWVAAHGRDALHPRALGLDRERLGRGASLELLAGRPTCRTREVVARLLRHLAREHRRPGSGARPPVGARGARGDSGVCTSWRTRGRWSTTSPPTSTATGRCMPVALTEAVLGPEPRSWWPGRALHSRRARRAGASAADLERGGSAGGSGRTPAVRGDARRRRPAHPRPLRLQLLPQASACARAPAATCSRYALAAAP